MPLQHEYRPKQFSDVLGNAAAMKALESACTRGADTVPHAYLITGPAGTGKTTSARLVASSLGCHENDFREMNSADFRGIDMVRDLSRKARLRPMSGPVRVWLLDECHKLTVDAQEAALKLLEEPPPHAFFVLATTNPEKLTAALKRRCHHCELMPLKDKEMEDLLADVWEAEKGKKIEPIAGLFDQIIELSLGSPGMGLSLLDSVMDLDPEEQLDAVRKHAAKKDQAIALVRALMGNAGWKSVKGILKELKGEDPESIRRMAMVYASNVLLNTDDGKAGLVLTLMRDNPTYDSGFPGLVGTCYEIIVG